MKQSFVIEVLRQENNGWRGAITWIEGQKKEYFRSTLEMLRLIDSAVGKDNEEK